MSQTISQIRIVKNESSDIGRRVWYDMRFNMSHSLGTRLRPLTLSVPKPIIDFVDKPMIVHQMEALARAGVDHIILALNYKAEKVFGVLKNYADTLNITLSRIDETIPLGTAGCLGLAKDILRDEECFFMLNSDVICNYPLDDLRKFHLDNKAEATILTTRVKDPSKYGVVVHDDQGRVFRFVEKPESDCYVGDEINAGIYCISSSLLDRVRPIPTSLEKQVFPFVAVNSRLFCYKLDGYWADIGEGKNFLAGNTLYNTDNNTGAGMFLKNRGDSNYISKSVRIGDHCKIGNNVVIGDDCWVGDFVRLENCVIMSGCTIGSGACIKDSIIGWKSNIGEWSHIFAFSQIGEDVSISEGITVMRACVLPHKTISDHTVSPDKIIM